MSVSRRGSSALSTSVVAGRAQAAGHIAPALGDGLQLAVAVELIPEQVHEHHDPRLQCHRPPSPAPPRPLRRRRCHRSPSSRRRCARLSRRTRSVARRRRCPRKQGGGDPARQVGPGGIGCHVAAVGAQAGAQQPCRGGLAVGGRDVHRATAEPPAEPGERTWLQPVQHHAGQACAPAAPGGTGERAGRGGDHLGKATHAPHRNYAQPRPRLRGALAGAGHRWGCCGLTPARPEPSRAAADERGCTTLSR